MARKKRERKPEKKRVDKPPLSKPKRVLFTAIYALLLVICSALLLLILEFAATPFVRLPSVLYTGSARLNHVWPPNRGQIHEEWITGNPEFNEPYTHYYNVQGWLENYDVIKRKPANTYRIFYLGDSFTEGCVPMSESIPSRVEQYLHHQYGNSGTHYEVINTGTSSYSPLIYYVLARYYLLDYSPDVLVVNVDMSDCFDDWKYRELLIVDDDGNPYAVPHRNIYNSEYVDTLKGAMKANIVSRTRVFLFKNSSLYNLISKWWNGGNEAAKLFDMTSVDPETTKDRWAWCRHDWDTETEADVAFTLDVLSRLAKLCDEKGVKLMITGVPHYQQFIPQDESKSPWSQRPHEALKRFAAEHSVAYLDSHAALALSINGTEQPRYYYRGNMHFNPRGFALWAQAHIDAFATPELELLPPDAK
ncbi:MAG: SGNH/GDSL hydrolase family protein [Planctomycetes bacterium]|nr:SGNH/GDSL hydrolase family protein [Planctomycetota bacterium]